MTDSAVLFTMVQKFDDHALVFVSKRRHMGTATARGQLNVIIVPSAPGPHASDCVPRRAPQSTSTTYANAPTAAETGDGTAAALSATPAASLDTAAAPKLAPEGSVGGVSTRCEPN